MQRLDSPAMRLINTLNSRSIFMQLSQELIT